MAAELSIMIKLGATAGGALAAIRSIGGGLDGVRKATSLLRNENRLLKKEIESLSDGTALKKLQSQYQDVGKTARNLRRNTVRQESVRTKIEGNKQAREELKSEAMRAVAAVGTVMIPVKMAMDFESSMADVKKVVDFDTPKQFQEMQQDILNLTHKIPMAGKELAAIAASGGQLGVARRDIAGFTEEIAKMSVAFDMSADAAGDSMAKLANVYKIPIAQIGRLGDAINHLSNKSPAKASDIVNTLGRVGGVAKQFGLTELQTASLSNAFISLGKTPEVAGTAINGMLTKLGTADKQGKKFQDALKAIGTDSKTLKKAIKENGERALMDFLKQIEKLPKENQMGALVDLFGLEYADDVAALVGGLDTYKKSIEELKKTGKDGKPVFEGSMSKEFASRVSTTAAQWQIFKNHISHLAISIGSTLLPAINELLADLKPLVESFIRFSDAHPGLVKNIFLAVAALAGFKAGSLLLRFVLNGMSGLFLGGAANALKLASAITRASGAFGLFRAGRAVTALRLLGFSARQAQQSMALFGKVSSVTVNGIGRISVMGSRFLTVVGSVRKLGTAAMWLQRIWSGVGMAMMANPIGLAVAAIAGAAFLIYKYWKPLTAFFAGLWDGLMQGLAPLKPMFDSVVAALAPVGQAIMSALGGIWSAVQPFVQPVLDWFGSFFSLSQVAEGGARSFGQTVGLWIGEKITGLVTVVSTAWTTITSLFSSALQGLLNLIASFSPVTAFQTAFNAVWSWLSGLSARFVTIGSQIVQGMANGIRSGASAVVGAISGMVSSATAKAKSMLGIHSPSRVFRSYGGFITQGLDIGISKTAARPVSTIGNMAGRLKSRFAEGVRGLRADVAARVSASASAFSAAREQRAQAASGQGGITVHFNPTINAPGGDTGQIQTAMKMSLHEFETMLRRVQADRARRAY